MQLTMPIVVATDHFDCIKLIEIAVTAIKLQGENQPCVNSGI